MDKLVIGCGYLGLRVARRWLAQGDRVFALTRKPERAEELRDLGIIPLIGDLTDPASLPRLPVARTVLFAVGHDRSSGKSIREVYVGGLAAALAALPESVERLIYISSTGVYGQSDGEIIDEDSPCQPARESGLACLEAEQTLRRHPLGGRGIVLRLAGIYGPGRIPLVKNVLQNEPITALESARLNLIHVDDAVEAVLAAEQRVEPPRLYVVSDGHPCRRSEFYGELARLLEAPPPRFAAPADDSGRAQRGGDRHIDNARMLRDLGVPLRFPSYREGLRAIVDQMRQSVERDAS
jgi:nucleoside-diphosphate-sugar epimerase